MRIARVVGILAVLTTASLISSSAFAQKIRSYGSNAEQQYGTSYQGSQAQGTVQTAQGETQAPTVQTQQQQGQAQAEGGEGDENAPQPSYVTVFRPGGAQAPLPVDLTPDKMYRGVIPGTRDEVDHLTEARETGTSRSESNRVIWVGFQPQDATTRVFFQTARDADYSLGQGEGAAVTLTFNNTKLSARNFGRFIDTSFFDRNVTRIEVDQVDKTTVVATITLRESARPDIDRSGNYLYVDFTHSGSSSEESSE